MCCMTGCDEGLIRVLGVQGCRLSVLHGRFGIVCSGCAGAAVSLCCTAGCDEGLIRVLWVCRAAVSLCCTAGCGDAIDCVLKCCVAGCDEGLIRVMCVQGCVSLAVLHGRLRRW